MRNYSIPAGPTGVAAGTPTTGDPSGQIGAISNYPFNDIYTHVLGYVSQPNENDILQRVINKGIYKPTKVKSSLSPSMDIQISSNFERLLFYVLKSKDFEVKKLMNNLEIKGYFRLTNNQKKIIIN